LIDQSNPLAGSDYSATVSGDGTITGKLNFGFISELPSGKNKQNSYTINFNSTKYLSFGYITMDLPNPLPTGDYMNSEGDFILKVPTNETLTILDPNGQLLIDTNYDGIYENGVTQFSSFEIRFRLKSANSLPLYTGTFSIATNSSNQLTFIHRNLSDTSSNRSAFQINSRVEINSDLDTVPDHLDLDTDNDGIPDFIEAQGKGFKTYTGIDTNHDGLDDAFEPGLQKINTDKDVNGTAYFVMDVLDLDSDNDGIYDLTESGSNAPDINKDGIIDGLAAGFGANGLYDALETVPDSGKLNYNLADTDGNGDFNYIDLDSDNDLCNDVIEAGFTDPNFDGQLGNTPILVNTNGIVTSTTNGYTTPSGNYIIANPILVTKQPENQSVCELQNSVFSIESNADGFQWQISTDAGNTWNSIVNNSIYSGCKTTSLLITKVNSTFNSNQYRVLLNKNNNACGLTSAVSTLTIFALPILNSPITIVQCDDDTDGISNFNVTEKNNFISANFTNETFTYYTTLAGANIEDAATLITNPTTYTSSNKSIWARVENANGCFSISQLNLIVSTTQINSSFKKEFEVCDDYIDAANGDKDGIATFNFSSITNDIQALLPSPSSNYVIKLYLNEADALAEINAILNPSNYRNTTPNQQEIWVRVDSNLDNACFGLGAYITLKVNPKPNIDINESQADNQIVCSNLPNFFVKLDAGIIDNTPTTNYTYIWTKDGSTIPGENNYSLDVNQEGIYTVIVRTPKGCDRTRTIGVKASDIAHLNSITISDLSQSNSVTVNNSGQGNYEYSMDLPKGPFQDSNFFDNISPGIHDVYIQDKNGCGTVKKTIAVLGIPAFFTPNNDGSNDFWNIKGANETFNTGAKIFIYDRYGKLIKQVIASGNGWDGTYTGNPMPADDYWYSIKLEDGRETKGHFTLKR
jgi:gliding motility-associated-like protein